MREKTRVIISVVMWVSPLLPLVGRTIDAVSNGYHTDYLTDPGHKKIRTYDALVLVLTWVTICAISIPGIEYYGSVADVGLNALTFISIIFPYLVSLELAALLYAVSIVVDIYGRNRQKIISRINKRAGFW